MILEEAVRRMLPKNKLGRAMLQKLKVYAGADHPHAAGQEHRRIGVEALGMRTQLTVPMIRGVLAAEKPVFGICLGHQMLALALGAKTLKMATGHHGANHPVKDLETGKVEITSMNHGFAVDAASMPEGVIETHVSLFDGSNCGLRAADRPVFSVQYHPEASPGPQDSCYLFERFTAAMAARKVAVAG